jgi:hypothetical protein
VPDCSGRADTDLDESHPDFPFYCNRGDAPGIYRIRGRRMIRPFKFTLAILATILVCSGAEAQMRSGAMSVRAPAIRLAPMARTSISMAAPRSTRLGSGIRILPNGQFAPAFSTFANGARYATANGVPGLGSDYAHLAAIRGGLRNNGSGNFGRGTHRRQTHFVGVLFGGYPYYYGDYYGDSTDYGQPQQQQVSAEQQPAPTAADQQYAGSGNDSSVPAAISSAPPAPVRDVGDFILVRRDGRVLFASAFSIVGDQLRYVTPEGIRHSVPLAEMDPLATQQMNEARGTTVQLHN